jgi:superkiller protein 3
MSPSAFFSIATLLALFVLPLGLPGGTALAQSLDGAQAQVLLQQAETAWNQGHFQDAAHAYRQVLKIKPDLAPAHYGLGLALARLERYQEAVGPLQEAVRLAPSWASARKDLGAAYLKLKRWPEATRACKAFLKHQPQDPEVLYYLGVAEGKQGRHQEARAAFEEALRLKPEYVQALNNLGMANIKLNRWNEAKQAFDRALGLKADSPETHLGLLACYIQQGDRQAASRTYQTLAKLDKNLQRQADALLGK